jgi:hypothetical protein
MFEGSAFAGVLVISFVLALLVVVVAWFQRGQNVKGSDPLLDVTFDFQHSWLSTFTVFLAVLGAMNFSSLAFSSDPSFSLLSLFFALLVALAPLLYRAVGAPTGTVGGFLVACAATLWAAFGILFSLGVLLSQPSQASVGQSGLATVLMMAVIILTVPLIAAYAHGKISALLRSSKALAGGATFL